MAQKKEIKDILLQKLGTNELNYENQDIEEEDNIIIDTELSEYFKDPEFLTLLKIVKNKPEYLQLVGAYLSHGEIRNEVDIESIDISNFKPEKELIYYNQHLMVILNCQ